MNIKKFGKRLRKCVDQAAYMQKLLIKNNADKQAADLPINTEGMASTVAELCERLADATTQFKAYRADVKRVQKERRKEEAKKYAEEIVRATAGQSFDPEPNAGDVSLAFNDSLFTKTGKPRKVKVPTMRAGKKGQR